MSPVRGTLKEKHPMRKWKFLYFSLKHVCLKKFHLLVHMEPVNEER